MDAKRLFKDAIETFINEGKYEITGVLETGEVTVAITGYIVDRSIKYIFGINMTDKQKLKRTKKLINKLGRCAPKIMHIYKQNCS